MLNIITMKIQFLGTSSGSPSQSRNVSGTALSFEKTKEWLLVDCGEATQHQILKSDHTAYHLGIICITHIHGDHCYGLPGLVASMSMSGRREPVNLIAPKKVIEFVHSTMSLTDLSLNFNLYCHAIENVDQKLHMAHCDIDIIELQHRVASYAFKITERCIPKKLHIDKLRAQGVESGPHYNQLQKGRDVNYKGQRLLAEHFTYDSWQARTVIVCGDNERPELLKPYIADVGVLIHEATFTESDLLKVGAHTGHSDAKRVAQFAQQNQVPQLILFHFSVRYHGEGKLKELKQEATHWYSGHLLLAEDFSSHVVVKHLCEQ